MLAAVAVIEKRAAAELAQGDNQRVAHQAADEYPGLFEETPGPRLFTGFLKISPDVGLSTPAIVFSVVVLPAPLCPTMPTNSPSATSIESPCTAAIRP